MRLQTIGRFACCCNVATSLGYVLYVYVLGWCASVDVANTLPPVEFVSHIVLACVALMSIAIVRGWHGLYSWQRWVYVVVALGCSGAIVALVVISPLGF